jgi:hypothetical protein
VPDDLPTPLRLLDRARADAAERVELDARIDAASRILADDAARLRLLREAMAQEQRDVERLGRVTPTRLWSSLRGRVEEDLDRERDEADAAAAAVEDCASGVERQQEELARLRGRSAALADAESRLDLALEIVARGADGLDASHPDAVRAAVRELALRREVRELEEAHAAGASALAALVSAHRVVQAADAWSGYDTFGGGGLLSSAIKHQRLDEARGALQLAGEALERLTRELDDLHLPAVRLGRFDGLTRGVDIWFDNIFTDLAVRSEIKRCRAEVENAIGRVEDVLSSLEERHRSLTGQR